MEQNKTGKYFKYAIGEIVLVVIGILIALQINNWNEARKSKAFEQEMLKQIQTNLISDKTTLSEIIKNNTNAILSSKKVLNLDQSEIDADSLKYWLGDIIQFDRFQPLTNAYEVLKSKGLDQITNKELRFLLGTYYDDKANHIAKAVDDINYTFVNDWLPILKKNVIELKFKKYVILQNYSIFTNPGEPRNIIILNVDNFAGSNQYINEGITIIDKIILIIGKELN
ncbi:MAG: hypothetical protein DA407_05450 [Bacteroidetes bacterium]|nr:MAG: hypothetical protein DA407_05450 [Bacteroidota bacterium]